MRSFFLLLLIGFSVNASAQKLKKDDKVLFANLQNHVKFLSSDLMEGRRTGTKGEQLAATYIIEAFKRTGLQPKGSNGYEQAFSIPEGRQVNTSSHLFINGAELKLHRDFFPLHFSKNASLEAMPSISLQEMQMPWFLDIKPMIEANAANPHFDLLAAIKAKAIEMQKKGATAVFVYNSSSEKDAISFDPKAKEELLNIPIVYLTKETAAKYLSEADAALDIKLKTDIGPKSREARNLVGYIDNGAQSTVIIGAHYDHLGFGEDGNSLVGTASKMVHNGADDNASGVAAMLELARLLQLSKNKTQNYLFIAFSGEELGLHGSKYFAANPTVNLSTVRYMINMDMVGRLNDSSKAITVGGYGTSPMWGTLYNLSGKQKLFMGDLSFRFDSSGTGPSDHTSFYLKDLPVLFYFTGLHTDYHKPSDDFEKINFLGEMNVVKHVQSLIEATAKRPEKIEFTKTRERAAGTSTRFSVTLGIMPDYTFGGNGVRADGISESKPAQKAGMKAGDIIVALGENAVTSIDSYMQALSKFKKGDKTTVVYQRGNEKHTVEVEF
jgi:hypothetical protein